MDIGFSLKRPRSDADEGGDLQAGKISRVKFQEFEDHEQARTSLKAKFLVLADTHDLDLINDPNAAFRLPASNVDVVLHCGDLTEDGNPSSIENAIKMLGKIPAELKLVIAGNHEITLDREHYLGQGGSETDHQLAMEVTTGPIAKSNGVTFLREGTHTFQLRNGASFTLFASPYTPKFGESAFQYPSCEDRFNPPGITPAWAKNTSTPTSTIPVGIDIVMTHGPPQYILDQADDGSASGCEHLRNAIIRAKPRLHCFGHIHPGYGAQRIRFDEHEQDGVFCYPKEFVGNNQAKRKGYASLPPSSAEAWKEGSSEQCLLVNAAIECVDGKPKNAPWMIEMDFQSRSDGAEFVNRKTTSLSSHN